ncbi:LOW QUALITY PROTEIN: hypothetical protein PHPALM_28256 [Phytophthora palmivora]|uniref:C2 domain-containing protein n=1 Tax=Phytophthora palmivora TaxID=4796 RepID=A0A2P4XAK3_9STRA|nr:LOW QUALITY PROTEIN: hypothetical protein PHPALM_28256 [Phytophthora palmivora]
MPISMAQTSPIQATLSPFSTLYLTIHSAQNVQFKSNRAYCKTFVANMPMVENTMFAHFSNNQFQSFKTDIVQVDNNNPVWNAKYEIRINDPKVEVLSILVKDQQLLCCAIVGVCVISIKNLLGIVGVDQWFALRKGQFQTGHLRLQMQLKKVEQPSKFGRTRISSDQSLFDRINRVESIYDDRCRRHGERYLREMEHHPRKQHRHHNNGKHQQTDDLNSSDKIDKSPEAVNEAFTSSLDQVRLTSDYEEGSLKTASERNPIKNNYADIKSSDIEQT